MKQIAPVDIVAPGSFGLNTERAKVVLDPRWAVDAFNCVRNPEGVLAARNGYAHVTTTPIGSTPDVKSLAEYRTSTGTSTVILAWDGGISNSLTDPAGSDISGAVTDSNGRWDFHNFRDARMIGFQAGQVPIVWTGSGNFASISAASGSAPQGGIGWCGYGRVWGLDTDGYTIKYSALLDETHWATGAGSIDMRNVWIDGTDQVVAITGFNGALVVFGKKHIVFWVDGQGSPLGLNPLNMYVADVIVGTGAISALAMDKVGDDDFWFVSPHGVQSLKRTVLQKSNPIASLTKHVRRAFTQDLSNQASALLRAKYDQKNNIFVVTMPTVGRSWVLGQTFADDEGDMVAVVTTWGLVPTALAYVGTGTLYLGRPGRVATYSGTTDNGAAIAVRWASPWIDLGEEYANRLKILKRYGAILFAETGTTVTFKWWIDFSEAPGVVQRTVTGDAGAEWGIDEWNLFEWSGGLSLRQFKMPIQGTAQYVRLGVDTTVSGNFAVYQAELFAKLGRLA